MKIAKEKLYEVQTLFFTHRKFFTNTQTPTTTPIEIDNYCNIHLPRIIVFLRESHLKTHTELTKKTEVLVLVSDRTPLMY